MFKWFLELIMVAIMVKLILVYNCLVNITFPNPTSSPATALLDNE